MRNLDRRGKKCAGDRRRGSRASPTCVSYRMMVRGGEGSGGPVRPTISFRGEAASSAATSGSSMPTVAGSAANDARQTWQQRDALPSSGGQPSQSPMSPPAIASCDIASDMLVALAPCPIVLAANITNNAITSLRTSCMFENYSCRRPLSTFNPFDVSRMTRVWDLYSDQSGNKHQAYSAASLSLTCTGCNSLSCTARSGRRQPFTRP